MVMMEQSAAALKRGVSSIVYADCYIWLALLIG